MNQICVIAKNKETYFIKRLIEEVGEGVTFFDPWSDFELPEAAQYIVRTTGVYGSDLDLMIIKSLDQGKVKNSYEVLNRFRSKSSQYHWFEEKNFPVLPWLPVKGTDLLTLEKFFRLYPEVVVKPLVGQGGWGIETLTWEKFKSWKKKKGPDQDYLMQPFIKNAIEFRYFFIKGKTPIVLQRSAKTGIAANFQKEGNAYLLELPEEHRQALKELSEASGAQYGAIDLFLHDGELLILELNAVPGIEQLEKVSGTNIIRLIFGTDK